MTSLAGYAHHVENWWQWETQGPRIPTLRVIAWVIFLGYFVWALATNAEVHWPFAVVLAAMFFAAPPGRVLVAPLTRAATRRADRLRS